MKIIKRVYVIAAEIFVPAIISNLSQNYNFDYVSLSILSVSIRH